jgi:hypothetical protein
MKNVAIVALVVVLWLNIAAGQSYRARIAQLEQRAAQVGKP